MLATNINVIPLTTIIRQRLLPVPGKVLARQGQKVGPRDVLAQAVVAPEHVVLDISRGLKIPAKNAAKFVQREVGELVVEGDVIATGPKGLMRRVIRAPCDGRIMLIRGGQVLLQRETTQFELLAGYNGLVRELIPDRGVVIESIGGLVQGVWGNGRIDFGLMQVLADHPDEELLPARLDVSLRGAVVMAGYCKNPETLQVAAEISLRGLILASMSVDLVKQAQQSPFPIVLTEGFGKLRMSAPAYTLLKTNASRDVTINAEAHDRFGIGLPEVVISLPVTSRPNPTPIPKEYAAGQVVRIVSAPHLMQNGRLMAVLPGMTRYPNGVMAQSGEVLLDAGTKVTVPLANLEVLGYK